jgi:transposase-like protein
VSKQPTQHAAKFKAYTVQEMLREETTVSHIAAEHGIHPNPFGRWKATVLAEMPSLFERRDQAAVMVAQVWALVQQYTSGHDLGGLGDPRVNVLQLNLALGRVKK